MMIERIRPGDIDDMIETLINFNILVRKDNKDKRKCVRLLVELEELTEALSQTKELREKNESIWLIIKIEMYL